MLIWFLWVNVFKRGFDILLYMVNVFERGFICVIYFDDIFLIFILLEVIVLFIYIKC